MKCAKGHYTEHFTMKDFQPLCPICGSRTKQCDTSKKSEKYKYKKRKPDITSPIIMKLI